MRLLPRQKIWLTLVTVANAALWLIPSNVIELIARDEHTLLGRYSRTHFSWNLAVLLISIVGCYIDWSRGPRYKRRWFQVIAITIFLVPMLAATDFALRTPDEEHYVRTTAAYHRPVNAHFHRTYVDRPTAFLTYPNAKPGFGTVQCDLHTDSRGYRNAGAPPEGGGSGIYDIVALGDSFTEGSNVSDEQSWPARLASLSGKNIYNLGMSGYDPFHYLESLKEIGLSLHPRIVLCMLCEGNDFRSTKSDEKRRNPSISKRLDDYFARSPLIRAADNLLVNTLGPIGIERKLQHSEMIDWLPLTIPAGNDAKYYAFEPKQLRDLYQTAEDFESDEHWLNPRGQIDEMNRLYQQNGARLIVILAPTKAHVALPLVADRLPVQAVRDFTAFSLKDLPAGDVFIKNLLARVDAKESVISDWCNSKSIPFISLTPALREAMSAGTQVYYSYDQHWTPLGHEVVASAINAALNTSRM